MLVPELSDEGCMPKMFDLLQGKLPGSVVLKTVRAAGIRSLVWSLESSANVNIHMLLKTRIEQSKSLREELFLFTTYCFLPIRCDPVAKATV
jgi:hypothetical protein